MRCGSSRDFRWSWSRAWSILRVRRARTLGLVAVADRLHQQILEAGFLEDLAQDVEDAALERLALDFQLLQQPMVNVAFAGLLGDEVPQMADLASGRCGGCDRIAVPADWGSTAGRS